MEALKEHLSKINVPCEGRTIYKDECVYSFDNPETPTGLYVNLSSFVGLGRDYVGRYAEHTEDPVFLHIRREKILRESPDNADDDGGPEKKITRLAIGVEGGYNERQNKKYEYKDTYSIVVWPNLDTEITFPNDELPLIVSQSVAAVLAQDSALTKIEKSAVAGTWDGEIRQISDHSETLKQLDNGKKIPPTGWKCEKCDLTNNLWLNLSDGSILCGRKFFDGSGGNDHAVEHYKEFGYPLAVKLGTISADGKADVFSYPEDDMVVDSKLDVHLKHFGINMDAMKKSEKSMVELELEINQRIGEWSLLTESDSELQPLAGPGLTGMRNLGNSCYINSVMQVLFSIPDFITRYVGPGAEKYFNEFPFDPANDFDIQMAKLGNGLWSGKYSKITENSLDSDGLGIAPYMFKNVVGKSHPDFSTKQQQDAYDFYLHMVNLMERHSRHLFNPIEALTFQVEERIECTASKKVRYTTRNEYCLQLPIPLEKATNSDEVKEYLEKKARSMLSGGPSTDRDAVRHKIPFSACLDKFFGDEMVEDFYSSAIDGTTTAKKTARMVNMPDYLLLHLRKFTLGDDWVPKKLDVAVQMPEELDLTNWRSTGLQDGEELLETKEEQPKPVFEFDEDLLTFLEQMGFPREACKRSVYYTKNIGMEAASNWLMEHVGDANFAEPFEVPDMTREFVPNPQSLIMLMSMGFDARQVAMALKATDNDVERATEWIFSHADDMDTDDIVGGPVSEKKNLRDGAGKYKLVAFISHMGTSAQVGHYVCHIKKSGQWVIFNDNKVALSQNPPKDLGYLYLYQREE